MVEGLGICSLLLAVVGLSLFSENPAAGLPGAGVFVVLSLRLLPLLQQTFSTILEIKGARAMAEGCADELEDGRVQVEFQITQSNGTYCEKAFDEIKIRNLNYSFNDNALPILSKVDLTIKHGDKIAIGGDSGSGKSTFVELLSLLDQPDNGSIVLVTEGLEKAFPRGLVYFVPQKSLIFNDTLKSNVLLCTPSQDAFDEEYYQSLLDKVGLQNVEKRFEPSNENSLGEGGQFISGGQGQRVSIARAIASKRPIIILDEATSALDAESERRILSILLADPNLTLIVVTHNKAVKGLFPIVWELKRETQSFQVIV